MHLDRWDRSLQLVQGFKSGVNYCPTLWQIVLVCVSVTDKDTVIPIMFRHQSPDEWINVFKLLCLFFLHLQSTWCLNTFLPSHWVRQGRRWLYTGFVHFWKRRKNHGRKNYMKWRFGSLQHKCCFITEFISLTLWQ